MTTTTSQPCSLVVVVWLMVVVVSTASPLQVVYNPEPIVVPLHDLVTFDCTMLLPPDRFEWLHLPNWPSHFSPLQVIDQSRQLDTGNSTTLQFEVDSVAKTGGYQCVAWYGAQAIASAPALLTIAQIGDFQVNSSAVINTSPGNTVALYCAAPPSDPPASVHYFRLSSSGHRVELKDYPQTPSGALVIQNVEVNHSGEYLCVAENWMTQKFVEAKWRIQLNVVANRVKEAPKFIRPLPNNYTIGIGQNLTLECPVIGTPPPKVTWGKLDSDSRPPMRHKEVTPLGLKLSNVTLNDNGSYFCEADNGVMPSIRHQIHLKVEQPPRIISFPRENSATEGDYLELECTVAGTPEPLVNWVINSRSVILDKKGVLMDIVPQESDSAYPQTIHRLRINPVAKRHAGSCQCFASNHLGTVSRDTLIKVYPKPVPTGVDPTPKKNGGGGGRKKGLNMIPPSKPNVTRISDTSVMVRWNVPENNGTPITFFKVQTREVMTNDPLRKPMIRNARWETLNEDIPATVRTYQVDNLWTDSVYKFRIAAVYKNNDNQAGPVSAKFHLTRLRSGGSDGTLPTPMLTRTEAVDNRTVQLFWELTNKTNATIEGFYINYRDLLRASEYIKVTVEDPYARTANVTHLVPGKTYDFKLQSFNAASVSDFSVIMSQRTHVPTTENDVTLKRDDMGSDDSSDGSAISTSATGGSGASTKHHLLTYTIIAAGVSVGALLTTAVAALLVCKRYKQDKSPPTPAGGSGAGGPPLTTTATGVPKLTITTNPLASATIDAEDKNQNVMEMSSFNNTRGGGGSTVAIATPATPSAMVVVSPPSTSANTTATTIKQNGGTQQQWTANSQRSENYV